MVFRLRTAACVTATLIWTALASGNSDQSSAIAPVTKGAAALVPPNVRGLPSVPRLVTLSPGALSPRLPIDPPKFDWLTGQPWRSQAATGITHQWLVMVELPTVPWLPAAATVITPRRAAWL